MRKRLAQLLVIGTLTIVGACSEEPATAPSTNVNLQASRNGHDDDRDDRWFDDEEFGRDPDLRYIAKFKKKPGPPNPMNDHARIGPQGGSLRVGEFEIIVPPGAVDRTINFRIRVPVDPKEAIRAFAVFEPHMKFNKPVTIRLPAASTDVVGQPWVLWWTGFFWWPLETTPTNDGRIEAKTWHFSTYGTSYWAKGITTLGG
jgi:hypothetical protein